MQKQTWQIIKLPLSEPTCLRQSRCQTWHGASHESETNRSTTWGNLKQNFYQTKYA